MQYKNLFSPMKLNNLTLKNRIIAPPCGIEYEQKAKGGSAMVICGHTIVEPGRSSFASGDENSAFFKYEVENTRDKIRKCHAAGARASIEIFHAGLYARVKEGTYAVGPCSLTREDGVEVKALDEQSMERIANLFAEASLEAKELGFDAIFLHFGHGWLPAQFLSPLFNHRTDEFGGPLENRMKFPLLILKKIRSAVGGNYPIEMRISAEECVPGSIEFKDTLGFILEAEKYIDGVQISAGLDINHEGNVRMATTEFVEHMPNVKWAKEVKKNVQNIKVSVVGAIMSPEEAEMIIATGAVDYVAFGRSLIADPDWPNKALMGRSEDIVPCIRCLQCYHIATNRRNVGCSVNPHYRNEHFIPKYPGQAKESKTVVVIGAGPAGLMAGLTAKKRGHKVTILEKSNTIGGTLDYVKKGHYKEDIRAYVEYLINQVKKEELNIVFDTIATKEIVKALNPEALVIAIGGRPNIPNITGINNSNVIDYLSAIDNKHLIGDRVAIIGGGSVGAELALELAEIDGKKISLIEMTDALASNGNMLYRIALRQKYENLTNPIDIHYKTIAKKITDDSVILENVEEKSLSEIKVDTVIVAIGATVNRELVDSFYGITSETYEVGDALRPRKIQEAVLEGYGVGNLI